MSVLVIQAEGAAPIVEPVPDDRAVDRHGAAVQDRRGAAVARDAGELRTPLASSS